MIVNEETKNFLMRTITKFNHFKGIFITGNNVPKSFPIVALFKESNFFIKSKTLDWSEYCDEEKVIMFDVSPDDYRGDKPTIFATYFNREHFIIDTTTTSQKIIDYDYFIMTSNYSFEEVFNDDLLPKLSNRIFVHNYDERGYNIDYNLLINKLWSIN